MTYALSHTLSGGQRPPQVQSTKYEGGASPFTFDFRLWTFNCGGDLRRRAGEREPKAGWNRTMIPALRQGSGARLARFRQRTRQRIFALLKTSPKLKEVRMSLVLQAGYEVALRGTSTWRVFFHVCNQAFGDAFSKTWIQGTPLSFSAPERRASIGRRGGACVG